MNEKKHIVLMLVALALIAGISIFFFAKDSSQEPSHNDGTKPAVTGDTTPVPPNNDYEELTFPDNTLDTSDWETYRTSNFDDNIAIEIKYPPGWKVKSYGENQQGPMASLVVYDKRIGDGADNGIYIEVQKTSLDRYLNANKEYSSYKKIKVNNARGVASFSRVSNKFLATSVKLENKNMDRMYEFYIGGPDMDNPTDPAHYLDVLEQIILSLKLLK